MFCFTYGIWSELSESLQLRSSSLPTPPRQAFVVRICLNSKAAPWWCKKVEVCCRLRKGNVTKSGYSVLKNPTTSCGKHLLVQLKKGYYICRKPLLFLRFTHNSYLIVNDLQHLFWLQLQLRETVSPPSYP